jgi:hypothetical protein
MTPEQYKEWDKQIEKRLANGMVLLCLFIISILLLLANINTNLH